MRRARPGGATLLAALFVAALALRPQLVGAGPLLPAIAGDLAVTHAVAGLLGTIPVLCMGVFAPAAGALAARWGLRAVMAGSVAVVAAFGLARVAAADALALLALTLPIGAGMAVAGTLLPMAVKVRFPHRPALANGVCTTGLNLGAAVSSALAVPAATASGGWRAGLGAFSVATVALAAGWLWLSRGGWSEELPARRPPLPFGRLVAWGIVAVFALNSVVYYGLVAWIADAFQERGWSPSSAGALLATMGLSALPSGLVVPWLADRGASRRRSLGISSGCLVVATLGFVLVPGAGFACAALAGAALGAIFPLCLAMCLDIADGPAETGAAAGMMFLVGYPLAALAPFGLGVVRDVTGTFEACLWVTFGAALLLLASCAPLTRERLRPSHTVP